MVFSDETTFFGLLL